MNAWHRGDRRRRPERLLRGRFAGRRRRRRRSPAAISRRLAEGGFDHAVATRDHHIDPGAALLGTTRTSSHLAGALRRRHRGRASCTPTWTPARIEAIFDKGEYAAAYSGFEAAADGVRAGRLAARRAASTPSRSSASPPTTAYAPPPWTPPASASPRRSASTSPPGWPRDYRRTALANLRAAGVRAGRRAGRQRLTCQLPAVRDRFTLGMSGTAEIRAADAVQITGSASRSSQRATSDTVRPCRTITADRRRCRRWDRSPPSSRSLDPGPTREVRRPRLRC